MTVTVRQIQAAVCEEFGVPYAELMSDRRGAAVVRARHAAAYLCRELTPLSYPTIGRYFNRHHTTVINSVAEMTEQMAASPELTTRIEALADKLDPEGVATPG